MKLLKYYNNIILLLVIIVGSYIGSKIEYKNTVEIFLTISHIIREILTFVLPFIIFSFLFQSVIKIGQGKSIVFLSTLITMVCLSNLTSNWFAYLVGFFTPSSSLIESSSSTLEINPLFSIKIGVLFSNDKAIIAAIVLGLASNFIAYKRAQVNIMANKLEYGAKFFLNKIFIPILPIFILGYISKAAYEGSIVRVIKDNYLLFYAMFASCIGYTIIVLTIAHITKIINIKRFIASILQPCITAITTMSSLAALPLSIKATSNNIKGKNIATSVLPITTNIHLLGDSICIPIMAFIILKSYGLGFPSIEDYVIFSFFFVVYKFAVAAVPGGGIIVMIPVLEKYLGFNAEMSAIITTFYILFDFFGTTMNVLGNNIFIISFNKLFLYVEKILNLKEKKVRTTN